MVHGDLALEPEGLEPCLVVQPQMTSAASDERVLLELGQARGNPVARRIVAAAVERPVIDAELPSDEAAGLGVAFGAAQRDVGLASPEVPHLLAGIEVDQDMGVALVKLAEDR